MMKFIYLGKDVEEPLSIDDDILPKPEKNDTYLMELTDIFPNHSMSWLRNVSRDTKSLDEAIDIILSKRSTDSDCTISEPKTPIGTESQTSSKQAVFGTLNEMLTCFRQQIMKSTEVLNVDRDELWRTALTFYKKAMKNPCVLKKDFEVCNNLNIFPWGHIKCAAKGLCRVFCCCVFVIFICGN